MTKKGIIGGFISGFLVGAIISAIILGVYFGVNFVGHILRSPAYDQSDLKYIDDIVHNKEKGIEVTVRGPTVYGGGHGYFAIWDRSSGMAGVDIYYPGEVMTDAPPGGIVEVTGTTISGRNGFGILGEGITVIESKPFFSLPTFGDNGTNLTNSRARWDLNQKKMRNWYERHLCIGDNRPAYKYILSLPSWNHR